LREEGGRGCEAKQTTSVGPYAGRGQLRRICQASEDSQETVYVSKRDCSLWRRVTYSSRRSSSIAHVNRLKNDGIESPVANANSRLIDFPKCHVSRGKHLRLTFSACGKSLASHPELRDAVVALQCFIKESVKGYLHHRVDSPEPMSSLYTLPSSRTSARPSPSSLIVTTPICAPC
jgi:hypothetical protein